jgi:hypothetical protein
MKCLLLTCWASVVATRANGQLAFGAYLREPRAEAAQANGLLVLTPTGSRIRAMTRFDDTVLRGRMRAAVRHEGLSPQLEFCDICRAGWDQYLPSLRDYLETGTGTPFSRARLG